jgi:type II secretion system (T2SS) protein E
MAIDVVKAPRWRISIEDAAWVAPLRDYLRRLGLEPRESGSLAFDVETVAPAADLEEYVASWVNVNAIPVQLLPVADEPAPPPAQKPLADALQPLILPPPRIGELLVRKGFITEAQLAAALEEARETNQLLGVVLLRKQLIFEDELARTLSQQLSIPYIRIMSLGVNNYVARLLPYEVGVRAAAIPVRADGDTVQVAFADPTDPAALAAVREHLPEITIAVAELSDIKTALRSVVGSGVR